MEFCKKSIKSGTEEEVLNFFINKGYSYYSIEEVDLDTALDELLNSAVHLISCGKIISSMRRFIPRNESSKLYHNPALYSSVNTLQAAMYTFEGSVSFNQLLELEISINNTDRNKCYELLSRNLLIPIEYCTVTSVVERILDNLKLLNMTKAMMDSAIIDIEKMPQEGKKDPLCESFHERLISSVNILKISIGRFQRTSRATISTIH